MYDVIVIGGGPVGSRVAAQMAGRGHRVAVLERRHQTGGKACTGIISGECQRAFAIDDNAILRRVNSGRLLSPSGKSIHLRREKAQACIVDRAAFEDIFIHRAILGGADYFRGTFVSKVVVTDRDVKIHASSDKDTSLLFESKAVVLANGFDMKQPDSLGLGRYRDFALGAQATVSTDNIDEVEVYFGKHVAPGFFGWLVPAQPGEALVGLLTRDKPQEHLKKLLQRLVMEGKVQSADVEIISAGIPLKPLPRTFGKRVLAVGDAAGQVKSTTCGGIYYGLLCADLAASTLHEASIEDDFSARMLSRYEHQWRLKLSRELEVDYYARKFFERLSDERIDHLFDVVNDYGIADSLMQAEDLSFDWHSTVVLRLMGHRMMSHALNLMGMPFRLGSET